MYRIFEFLRRIYVFLLFILFEGIAIYTYAHSNSYSQAKVLSYTASITGGVSGTVGSVGDYFKLRRDNKVLLERIVDLEQSLAKYDNYVRDSIIESLNYDDGLGIRYRASRVIANTLNRQRNYLIINSGLQDGIRSGMAVVTPNREMVGIVMECSDNHSVVMSILNTLFRSSGKLEGDDDHAGSIYWDGENRYLLNMTELSKYSNIKKGANIVTTGFSSIFPMGITIGSVSSYKLNIDGQAYDVEIDIAANMTALNEVLVVSDMKNVEVMDIINSDLFKE